jgi:predicted RNA-binding Zn-ribbon protein involved in translation (DUF1610 family)
MEAQTEIQNNIILTLSKGKTNVTEEPCPDCGKLLRFKPPCCSDKYSYLVCPCGFKKVWRQD